MKKIISFILLLLMLVPISNHIAFCEIHYASDTYKAAKIPDNKIIVYPNPWIPESGVSTTEDTNRKNTIKHGHLGAEGWIKFAGMKKDTGNLRIYDIAGNLVRNFHWNAKEEANNFPVSHYEFSSIKNSTITYYETQEYYDVKSTEGPNYKIIHWDGKDNNFEYVKSGVYIWILTEDGGRSHHGKLVVVR